MNAVANAFAGGHVRAAGCRMEGRAEEVTHRLLTQIKHHLAGVRSLAFNNVEGLVRGRRLADRRTQYRYQAQSASPQRGAERKTLALLFQKTSTRTLRQ